MVRRITDTPVPQTLFKYRDWSNKFHRRIITNQEVYLPRPSEFNDPFDGNIPVRWDLLSYDDCVEMNLEMLKAGLKDEDPIRLREYAKKVTDGKTLYHPDKMFKESPEQIQKWDSMIGLFSLSSLPDNILMWSHYSNNHTGFVVGFNTKSLIEEYDFDYLEPINYQQEYPMISGFDDTTTQFHKKFFYKSDLWEYENEWRISKNHIENRIVKLNKSTINQIILGCRLGSEQSKNIIKLCKKHFGEDLPIYIAKKDENNFELSIVPID